MKRAPGQRAEDQAIRILKNAADIGGTLYERDKQFLAAIEADVLRLYRDAVRLEVFEELGILAPPEDGK